jgi:lipopolysaccharide transport system permease protein
MALGKIKALWAYRDFILGSVKREFQLRYSGSLLGAGWNVINPLVMVLVYTVIFSEVMRAKLPGVDDVYAYGIYVCCGILAWGLFTEIITRSQNVFLENANLLKKSNFPRVCLPAIVTLSALLNFAIVFGLFIAMLAISGRSPGWTVLTLVPVLVVEIVLATGFGILVGTLNVFFRDVGQLMGVVLQFWFWLTPIVYPVVIIPDTVRHWLRLNPMVAVIAAYQGVFVTHSVPQWESLLPVVILAVVMLGLGYATFRANSDELVDEL